MDRKCHSENMSNLYNLKSVRNSAEKFSQLNPVSGGVNSILSMIFPSSAMYFHPFLTNRAQNRIRAAGDKAENITCIPKVTHKFAVCLRTTNTSTTLHKLGQVNNTRHPNTWIQAMCQPQCRIYKPRGLNLDGSSADTAGTSTGSCTRDCRGCVILASATQGSSHGPPPTSTAAARRRR